MDPKDYYLILGISPGESPRGVRKAFRDLARQHHPDRAGPDGTPMFRDVVEAYRVLSDPEQRRRHDAERGQRVPEAGQPSRVTQRRNPAPRPGERFGTRRMFAEPSAVRPTADDLLDRILRNFLDPGATKAEHPEALLCDVALSRAEAHRGGVLPVRIPVAAPCATCHGLGHVAGFVCLPCDGSGAAPSEVVVPLEISPGVPSGAILELPLAPWGIRNLWLRARIRVTG